jgi:multidrug efflux pump subunit AcrB
MGKTQTLTISKATQQATARVRQLMPGELVTGDTRRSYDLTADKALLITTVTYPAAQPAVVLNAASYALSRMPGVRSVEIAGTGYMTITREA